MFSTAGPRIKTATGYVVDLCRDGLGVWTKGRERGTSVHCILNFHGSLGTTGMNRKHEPGFDQMHGKYDCAAACGAFEF